MAKSYAHRFGQIIGDLLEAALVPHLQAVATKHRLYLDKKGVRECRETPLCTWHDEQGNSHDLDFVLERWGSPTALGIPAAFIETAWRRYTKHSRAKAQEIEGAILPLREKYKYAGPFMGAVLAGVFTPQSLEQLKSRGFCILLISMAEVVGAFAKAGIDASSTEQTSESEFKQKVRQFEKLRPTQKQALAESLLHANSPQLIEFLASLDRVLSRQISRVRLTALHGSSTEFVLLDDAMRALSQFDEREGSTDFVGYEVAVHYDNGDVINGNFKNREGAMNFLVSFRPKAPNFK